MAGIEKGFGVIPDHRGPYVRKIVEIPGSVGEKGEKKRRTVTIIDVNKPLSQTAGRKK